MEAAPGLATGAARRPPRTFPPGWPGLQALTLPLSWKPGGPFSYPTHCPRPLHAGQGRLRPPLSLCSAPALPGDRPTASLPPPAGPRASPSDKPALRPRETPAPRTTPPPPTFPASSARQSAPAPAPRYQRAGASRRLIPAPPTRTGPAHLPVLPDTPPSCLAPSCTPQVGSPSPCTYNLRN